ncbi:Planctomycete cytochrome C [Planctomycetales bacterium 10988]|nr:Planctomycete cytochrome C [Planctomycetales bacterium 10988]
MNHSLTMEYLTLKRANPFRLALSLLMVLGVASTVLAAEDKKKEEKKVTFDQHVQSIFRSKCGACHNPDRKIAGLDLTSYTSTMLGGNSGEVVIPGDPDSSYLFGVTNHDYEPFMPPNADRIADEMVATIKTWIEQGALENAGSKAVLPDKPKVSFSLETVSLDRPETPPMPENLSLDPVVVTSRPNAITAMATNPWSPLVAVAGSKAVLLYHGETQELIGVLPFPEGVPHILKFSQNGSLLLAGGGHGGQSGRVVIWDVKTGERRFEIGSEFDVVLGADISSDQTLVALGGPGKVVRVYSTATGEVLYELRKHTDWIYTLAFSPDSVLLATGDRSGGLWVWEAQTGREYLTLEGHKGSITDVSWRSDSNMLASGSEDGSVKLWEVMDGKNIKSWNAHGSGVLSVEFSRDGRVMTSGRDKEVKLFDGQGKGIRTFKGLKDLALEVAMLEDGSRIFGGDWSGEIKIWNVSDGKEIGVLTSNPPSLAARVEDAQQKASTIKKKLDDAQKQLDSMKQKSAQETAAIQQANQEITKLNNLRKQLNAEVAKLKADLPKEKAAIQQKQKSVMAIDAKVKEYSELLSHSTEVLSENPNEEALKKVQADLQALKQNTEKEKNAQQGAIKAHEAKVAAMEKQLALKNKQLEESAKQLQSLQTKINTHKKEVETITAKLKEVESSIKSLQPQVKQAEEQLQRLTEAQQRTTENLQASAQ